MPCFAGIIFIIKCPRQTKFTKQVNIQHVVTVYLWKTEISSLISKPEKSVITFHRDVRWRNQRYDITFKLDPEKDLGQI